MYAKKPWPGGRRRPSRFLITVIAGLGCAALLGAGLSPAWAGGGGDSNGTGSVVVGGFGLGDGLEAAVSERDGAFEAKLALGALPLRWDSRLAGVDRSGLGPGWHWAFGGVQTDGGVELSPVSGGSSYPIDPTHPSGLLGYGLHDLVFEQSSGVLPGRGGAADRNYAFVLHELGARTTFFSDLGDPLARVEGADLRTDWFWDDAVPHRLTGMTDVDGVRTVVDWESEPGHVIVRATTGNGEAGDGATGGVWRIQLDGGRIGGLLDPVGGRIDVGYDDSGLLVELTNVSGARTEVAWRSFDDGVARVERVRTVDADGAPQSLREWTPAGDGTPSSGWPAFGGESDVFWSGDPSFRYRTAVSDGATRVESEYNSSHLLVSRRMIGSTPSGDHVLHEQAFTMPGTDGGGVADPEALPSNWTRPYLAEVTFRDPRGGVRTQTTSHEFDEFGRMISAADVDGTVTTTAYDAEVPEGCLLPVGLVVGERLSAPDGLTQTVTHTLNAERTAVIATETVVASGPDEPGTVTALAEFEVDGRGVVTEERIFPRGDRAAEPVVTRREERIDALIGTKTYRETVAAGTPAEATTTETVSMLHGGVIETVSPAGVLTSATYDDLGRSISIVDGAGRATTTRYESAQSHGRNAIAATTPDGVVRTEVHDVLGRLVQLTDNVRDGAAEPGFVRIAETREYPEPGIMAITDAWGATTTTRQDVFGRTVETVGPTGLTQLAEHDDVAGTTTTALTATGRLSDAEAVSVEHLDDAGRVVGTSGRRADGGEVLATEERYDGFGRSVFVGDGVLDVTTELDVFGNPVRTSFAAAAGETAGPEPTGTGLLTAERRFNGLGNSVEKVLSDGSSSRSGGSRVVDGLGRSTSETDQLGTVTTTDYTVDGLVSRVAVDGGRVAEHTYDPRTRAIVATSITSPLGATVRTQVERDPVTDRVIGVWDPADRAGTEIRTAWDDHGNPTTTSYPDGSTIEVGYDAHGRRVSMTDVAGNTTTYEHEPTGLMRSAVQRDPEGRELARVGYEYDAYGRITNLSRGNGVRTEIDYSSASEIARERTFDGDRTLTDRRYRYDAAGNLAGRTDTTFDAGTGEPTSLTTEYGYDALGRLRSSAVHEGDTADAPTVEQVRYELNASGDVASEVVTRGGPSAARNEVSRSFVYDERGALTQITSVTAVPEAEQTIEVATQIFDAAGNLVRAADGTTYAYDAANRPVAETAADGTAYRMAYWPDGTRRSVARGSGEATEFHWDGNTLVNETVVGSNGGVASYLLGAVRHARTAHAGEQRETAYYVSDRHGSVTELLDASGAPIERYGYRDYGVRTEGTGAALGDVSGNPYGFAGEYTDETGDQFLRIRSYQPAMMRFTSPDPAPLHNPYGFADLNPVTKVDPSGNSAIDDVLNGILLAASALALVLTAASVIYTGPAALAAMAAAGYAFGAVMDFGVVPALSMLAAAGATAIGIAIHVEEHTDLQVFDNPGQREDVQLTEYALAAFGVLAAIPSIVRGAAKLWGALTKPRDPAPRKVSTSSVGGHQAKPSDGSSGAKQGSKPSTQGAKSQGQQNEPVFKHKLPTPEELKQYKLRHPEVVWAYKLDINVHNVKHRLSNLVKLPDDAPLSVQLPAVQLYQKSVDTLVTSVEFQIVHQNATHLVETPGVFKKLEKSVKAVKTYLKDMGVQY